MICPFCQSDIAEKSFICKQCKSNVRIPSWESSIPIPVVEAIVSKPTNIFREPSSYSLAFIASTTVVLLIVSTNSNLFIYLNMVAAAVFSILTAIWAFEANIWQLAIMGFGQPLISFGIFCLAKKVPPDSLLVTQVLDFAVKVGACSFVAALATNVSFKNQPWSRFMDFKEAIGFFGNTESTLSKIESITTKISSIASIGMALYFGSKAN
jgi:hypothetical protein